MSVRDDRMECKNSGSLNEREREMDVGQRGERSGVTRLQGARMAMYRVDTLWRELGGDTP